MYCHFKPTPVKALFLDIGGVLLTDGWGSAARARAVEHFNLDKKDLEERHQMVFDNYELGKISLDEYLDWVIFYQPKDFTKEAFTTFLFAQSSALEGHLDFFKEIKQRHGLRVFAVSNEAREINEHRITTFGLDGLFDAYVTSCYVHLHKPEFAILQLACDLAHLRAEQALYIDDRRLLVDVATNFGLQTLHFQGLDSARELLQQCTFQP